MTRLSYLLGCSTLVALLFVAAICYADASGTGTYAEFRDLWWGMDLPGADLKVIPMKQETRSTRVAQRAITARDCRLFCANDAQCKAWTYVTAGTVTDLPHGYGRCILKSSVPAPVWKRGHISGVKPNYPIATDKQRRVESDTDRPGNDFFSFEMDDANAEECLGACFAEARCRAWTAVLSGPEESAPRCYLKNAVPPPRSNARCVSGVK